MPEIQNSDYLLDLIQSALDPEALDARRGAGTADAIRQRTQEGLDESRDYMASTTKTLGDTILDTTKNVATGVGTGLVDLASFGTGLIGARGVSQGLANLSNAAREYSRSLGSVAEQAQERLFEREEARDTARNQAQYEEDIKNGMSPTEAMFKRGGRNFLGSISNAFKTGNWQKLGAEGIGSMVSAGIAGAGTRGLMNGVARASKGFMGSATEQLAKAAERTAAVEQIPAQMPRLEKYTPWAVSQFGMEGGGQFSQALTELLDPTKVTTESLYESSPVFGELVQRYQQEGKSQAEAEQQAREDIAHNVALKSGIGTGLLASLLSPATQFLERPFTRAATRLSPKAGFNPIRKAAGTQLEMTPEYLEEMATEGGGQYLQNLLSQQYVDRNQDLGEGVGKAMGGAVVGTLGMTAPRTAVNTFGGAAQGAMYLKNKITGSKEDTQETSGETAKASETPLESASSISSVNANIAQQIDEDDSISEGRKAGLKKVFENDLNKRRKFSQDIFDTLDQDTKDKFIKARDGETNEEGNIVSKPSLKEQFKVLRDAYTDTTKSDDARAAAAAATLELAESLSVSDEDIKTLNEAAENSGSENLKKQTQDYINTLKSRENAFNDVGLKQNIQEAADYYVEQAGGIDAVLNEANPEKTQPVSEGSQSTITPSRKGKSNLNTLLFALSQSSDKNIPIDKVDSIIDTTKKIVNAPKESGISRKDKEIAALINARISAVKQLIDSTDIQHGERNLDTVMSNFYSLSEDEKSAKGINKEDTGRSMFQLMKDLEQGVALNKADDVAKALHNLARLTAAETNKANAIIEQGIKPTLGKNGKQRKQRFTYTSIAPKNGEVTPFTRFYEPGNDRSRVYARRAIKQAAFGLSILDAYHSIPGVVSLAKQSNIPFYDKNTKLDESIDENLIENGLLKGLSTVLDISPEIVSELGLKSAPRTTFESTDEYRDTLSIADADPIDISSQITDEELKQAIEKTESNRIEPETAKARSSIARKALLGQFADKDDIAKRTGFRSYKEFFSHLIGINRDADNLINYITANNPDLARSLRQLRDLAKTDENAKKSWNDICNKVLAEDFKSALTNNLNMQMKTAYDNLKNSLGNRDDIRASLNATLGYSKQYLALNCLDFDALKNKQFKVDEDFVECLTTATLQAAIGASLRQSYLDASRVEETYGVTLSDYLKDPKKRDQGRALMYGSTIDNMVESIASKMMNYSGVKFDTRLPSGLAEDLYKAMAYEALHALKEAKYINITKVVLQEGKGEPTKKQAGQSQSNTQNQNINLDGINDVFASAGSENRHAGTPKSSNAHKGKNNKQGQNNSNQTQEYENPNAGKRTKDLVWFDPKQKDAFKLYSQYGLDTIFDDIFAKENSSVVDIDYSEAFREQLKKDREAGKKDRFTFLTKQDLDHGTSGIVRKFFSKSAKFKKVHSKDKLDKVQIEAGRNKASKEYKAEWANIKNYLRCLPRKEDGSYDVMSERSVDVLLAQQGTVYRETDIDIKKSILQSQALPMQFALQDVINRVNGIISKGITDGLIPTGTTIDDVLDNVDLQKALDPYVLHFAPSFSRANRDQLDAGTNPMNNKVYRECFTCMRSTIDLSKDSDAKSYFLGGLGQAIFGLKPEDYMNKEDYTAELEQAFGDVQAVDANGNTVTIENPIVTEARKYFAIEHPTIAQALAFNKTLRALGIDNGDINNNFFHCLDELIKYTDAKKDPEKLKNFTTDVYIDFDGKSNGTCTKNMTQNVGQFSVNELERLGLLGVFFGKVHPLARYRAWYGKLTYGPSMNLDGITYNGMTIKVTSKPRRYKTTADFYSKNGDSALRHLSEKVKDDHDKYVASFNDASEDAKHARNKVTAYKEVLDFFLNGTINFKDQILAQIASGSMVEALAHMQEGDASADRTWLKKQVIPTGYSGTDAACAGNILKHFIGNLADLYSDANEILDEIIHSGLPTTIIDANGKPVDAVIYKKPDELNGVGTLTWGKGQGEYQLLNADLNALAFYMADLGLLEDLDPEARMKQLREIVSAYRYPQNKAEADLRKEIQERFSDHIGSMIVYSTNISWEDKSDKFKTNYWEITKKNNRGEPNNLRQTIINKGLQSGDFSRFSFKTFDISPRTEQNMKNLLQGTAAKEMYKGYAEAYEQARPLTLAKTGISHLATAIFQFVYDYKIQQIIKEKNLAVNKKEQPVLGLSSEDLNTAMQYAQEFVGLVNIGKDANTKVTFNMVSMTSASTNSDDQIGLMSDKSADKLESTVRMTENPKMSTDPGTTFSMGDVAFANAMDLSALFKNILTIYDGTATNPNDAKEVGIKASKTIGKIFSDDTMHTSFWLLESVKHMQENMKKPENAELVKFMMSRLDALNFHDMPDENGKKPKNNYLYNETGVGVFLKSEYDLYKNRDKDHKPEEYIKDLREAQNIADAMNQLFGEKNSMINPELNLEQRDSRSSIAFNELLDWRSLDPSSKSNIWDDLIDNLTRLDNDRQARIYAQLCMGMCNEQIAGTHEPAISVLIDPNQVSSLRHLSLEEFKALENSKDPKEKACYDRVMQYKDASTEAIVAKLNEYYNKKLKKLNNESDKATQDRIAEDNKAKEKSEKSRSVKERTPDNTPMTDILLDSLGINGSYVDFSGVSRERALEIINGYRTRMLKLSSKLNERKGKKKIASPQAMHLSSFLKALMENSFNNPAFKNAFNGLKLYTVSSEKDARKLVRALDVNEKGQSNNKRIPTNLKGIYIAASKAIVVVQKDEEDTAFYQNLVHELIHMSLQSALDNYFTDPEAFRNSAGEDAVHKIEHIITLKNDFIRRYNDYLENPKDKSNPFIGSFSKSVIDIAELIKNAPNDYVAVQEFCAYALTSPHVTAMLSGSTNETQIKEIFGETLADSLINEIKGSSWLKQIRDIIAATIQGIRHFFQIGFAKDYVPTFINPGVNPEVTEYDVLAHCVLGTAQARVTSTASQTALNALYSLGSGSSQSGNQFFQRFRSIFTPYISKPLPNKVFDAMENSMRDAFVTFGLDPLDTTTALSAAGLMMISKPFQGNQFTYMNEIYKNAMEHIKPSMFSGNGQAKYDALFINKSVNTDATKDPESYGVAHFFAMAMASPEIQNVLKKIPYTKYKKATHGMAIDRALMNFGNNMLEHAQKSSYDINGRNAQQEMSQLINFIADHADKLNQVQQRNRIEKSLDNANIALRNGIKSVLRHTPLSPFVDAGLQPVLSIIGEKEMPEWIRRLCLDITGSDTRTGATEIYNKLNASKSEVDSVRYRAAHVVPNALRKLFKNELTGEQDTAIYNNLIKTDLASSFDFNDAIKYVTDGNARGAQMRASLQAANLTAEQKLLADNLAKYLATGEANGILRTNALSIVWDASNSYQKGKSRQILQQKALERAKHLDKYISLKALSLMDTTQVSELAKTDLTGLEGMFNNYKKALDTQDKANVNISFGMRLNAHKGFTPLQQTTEASIVYSDVDLSDSGFVRTKENRNVWYTPFGGNSRFSEGIVRHTRMSYRGSDSNNGLSVNSFGKVLPQNKAQDLIKEGIPFRQVFDHKGNWSGIEPIVSKEFKDKYLKPSDKASDQIGIFQGRVLEEVSSQATAISSLKMLADLWKNGRKDAAGNRKGYSLKDSEYVNLYELAEKNPLVKEALDMLPPRYHKLIEAEYGKEGVFMVPRNLVYEVIGIREFSVVDMFTGKTNMSPKAVETITNILKLFLGPKCVYYLKNGEAILQKGVKGAKETILVRSISVLAGNIISNIFTCMAYGISPITMIKRYKEIQVASEAYLKNTVELQSAVAMRDSYPAGSAMHNKYQAIIDSTTKALNESPVSQLVNWGHMNTVEEMGVAADDSTYFSGDLYKKLESAIPDSLSSVVKYGLITKDTALYTALNKTLMYGDFIAKQIVKEHLEAKGWTPKMIQEELRDAFVDYNRHPGRVRGYLENIGLAWFWNYKLRVLHSMSTLVRNNPLFVLMACATPSLLGINNIITDNFLGAMFRGTLSFAIGPEMLANAFTMHPLMAVPNMLA